MKICGIIAEYNPLHNGHIRHINETRRMLGDNTAVVCAMSGNYVQRGDLAIMEKYQRAESAVRCGADLVLEMPLSACLSSAEGFALGGVSLLESLGCITHLSFGSEVGNITPIRLAARISKSAETAGVLQRILQEGLPYAAAMQRAVSMINAEAGKLFETPNNTLGIAYCTALDTLCSKIEPITVLRVGAAHDAAHAPDNLPSASHLRHLLAQNKVQPCQPLMPDSAFTVLLQAIAGKTAPVWASSLDLAIISHLRRLSPLDLAHFCGGGDGLEHRLWNAVQEYTTFPEICTAAQTRRYTLARIRRSLLRAWLSLPYNLPVTPDYIRVLAIGKNGRDVLRRIKHSCALPIILKPAHERRLPKDLQPALNRDRISDDLYALALPKTDLHVGGGRYRKTPYFHQSSVEI